jgi:transposase
MARALRTSRWQPKEARTRPVRSGDPFGDLGQRVDTFDKLLWELERCWMSTTRRQFTDEFKREAVGLLASSGRPLSQIARELGIAASMLRAWRDAGGRGNAGPPRRSNTQAAAPHSGIDLASKYARLRLENERLHMEREILKKHCASSRKHRDEISSHRRSA